MTAITSQPDELTKNERDTLRVLRDITEWRAPTHRRIAEKAPLASRGSVSKTLKSLQRKINPDTGKPYIDEEYRIIE